MASTDRAPVIPTDDGGEIDLVQLIASHQAGVWRYLRALGCDVPMADDLTQDTFLEIMRRPFIHYNDHATAGYLRRVAHNLFITLKRRSGKVIAIERPEEFETAWMRWAGFDGGSSALDALEKCFQRLSQRAQLALRMRFGEDASREAIADALKISEHGAKNLMQRAKTMLKECVESKLQ